MNAEESLIIHLPPPPRRDASLLESLIFRRRSRRSFSSRPVSREALSLLLWAVQGVTSPEGFRTAPSAGALYPLEVFIICGPLPEFPAGVYHYRPETHTLARQASGDCRAELARAAWDQDFIAVAPVTFLIAADFRRTTAKYGRRGVQYVFLEAGHAAQNLYLAVERWGLGTVAVGAFREDTVRRLAGMNTEWTPIYLLPVGYPRKDE